MISYHINVCQKATFFVKKNENKDLNPDPQRAMHHTNVSQILFSFKSSCGALNHASFINETIHSINQGAENRTETHTVSSIRVTELPYPNKKRYHMR